MKSIRTHDLSDASSSVCDKDLILHKAVGILRKHIGDLVIVQSISEALDRVKIVKLSSFDDGF
jgi:hypothetical protein